MLDHPEALSLEQLSGTDVEGPGRAVKSLVDSGQPLADALLAVGLNQWPPPWPSLRDPRVVDDEADRGSQCARLSL